MPTIARSVFVALAIAGASVVAGMTPAAAQAECHPAYGGCLPYYEGDALNCADIGDQAVEVWDPNIDPYNLDAINVAGNGWTCDGIG